ncbi:GPI inositol deacylase, partial [Coniosporium uncinatum]
LDPKGAGMSRMASSYVQFAGFDTEHTRFATKYNLYLYRELGIDEDPRVKGVPVLFIPGNAGSYKQVRSLAAEAAYHYHNLIRPDPDALSSGKRALDFFTVDFNEDITAFHGQTLLDQAEYLNDAIAYILSLYHNPHRSTRDPSLPDPSSVIVIGHSMGGIVARTMLTMPNYQSNSINTIITLSAPHARAPVSFDSDIVRTYEKINDYWRHSYGQKWANDNPLWHVTLISIAGGGLDTVVPSDYASIESLVPDTHGFTVFTSTIANVWTGMDHLAITWCDQLRKAIIRSLYDVIDVSSPVQTRKRADRMRSFKHWFLTGMEDAAEKTLTQKEPKTLLTLEDNSNAMLQQGQRLELRLLGETKKPRAYLLP